MAWAQVLRKPWGIYCDKGAKFGLVFPCSAKTVCSQDGYVLVYFMARRRSACWMPSRGMPLASTWDPTAFEDYLGVQTASLCSVSTWGATTFEDYPARLLTSDLIVANRDRKS